MKKVFYIVIGTLLLFGLSSCDKWLDVNNNPNSANATIPTPDLRLRSIQMQFIDAYESSGTRAAWITQNITKTGTAANNNDAILRWDFPVGSATWPYQAWFIYTACNLQPLIEKATAEEAWHYVGAAQLIHAWGFMIMLDLYGEMPYEEALASIRTAKYDDGKTIYYGCMDMLEKAIENLSKTQPASATPLSSGDIWNGGSADKWLKLAYGLKARWLNNLSKKSFYDPLAVLAALEKAPQSVADNTVTRFINSSSSDRSGTLKSLQHGNVSRTGRMTKWYKDLLTNTFTGGSGVVDPRTNRLIPSAEYYDAVTGIKEWRLSEGVDMSSNIRTDNSGPTDYEIMATKRDAATDNPSGFVKAVNVTERGNSSFTNRWFTDSKVVSRQGDSVYVSVYSEVLSAVPYNNDRTFAYHFNGITESNNNYSVATINVRSTGSFYIRADGPAHMVCYHEMCFIKAEVLFRLNRKSEALAAYKEGIRAHMVAMNEKLAEYTQELGKQTIPVADINAFLASAAVAQTDADLTMAKIMQQKQIAMSMTLQNWTDMRRFDYSKPHPDFGVVYVDFARPYEYNSRAQECYPATSPTDTRYWPRRIMHSSLEQQYNVTNWLASHPEASARTILSAPVWWDIVE